jgi:exonuclease III
LLLLRPPLQSYFDEQDADIIALCEVKADSDTVKREFGELGEPVTGAAAAASGSGVASSPLAAAFAGKKPAPAKYHRFFNCCTTKKGYSGTAILSKVQPIAVTYGINNKEVSKDHASSLAKSV